VVEPNAKVWAALMPVLVERARQDAKWGEQNHPIVGVAPWRAKTPHEEAARLLVPSAGSAKALCDEEHRACRGTYASILVEEVAELVEACVLHGDASDEAREEAVQVAAVALAIVECIDRKRAAKGGGRG